jgi:hypothetical protein
MPIGVSMSAKSRIDALVTEELQGVSSGTAMAAMLRPLGLVLVPQLDDQKVTLAIADVRESTESWPIGWPPEKRIRLLVPKLFDRLNAEISDSNLDHVLKAIQLKLKIPFLIDQNSLAQNDIDLSKTLVKFPSRATYYKKVIDHILTNQLLQAEIRVDEAGQPFAWISSSK